MRSRLLHGASTLRTGGTASAFLFRSALTASRLVGVGSRLGQLVLDGLRLLGQRAPVLNRPALGKENAQARWIDAHELIGPSDMRSDGIHPSDPGYDKIGKAVFELMVKEGMRR